MSFLWLEGLESSFPGFSTKTKTEKDEGQPKLNVSNTVAKVAIDQTVGGAWNTVLFIMTIGTLRGLDYEMIMSQIQNVSFSFQAPTILYEKLLLFQELLSRVATCHLKLKEE